MKDIAMVRVLMLRNKSGSPDGVAVNHYEKGKEYDVPEALANLFIETDKVAEAVTGKKAEARLENKADKAPKNKADKAA
jgi:hypothetical protein